MRFVELVDVQFNWPDSRGLLDLDIAKDESLCQNNCKLKEMLDVIGDNPGQETTRKSLRVFRKVKIKSSWRVMHKM